MYGLRDAGASFDRKVLDVMKLMGVSLSKFSICVGYRKVMNMSVRLVRWGDDFSLSYRRFLCNTFRDDLGKHLLVKTAAVCWDPNAEMGDVQEGIHLNRLLRLYPPGAEGGDRWELEADPRHVEILVSQMGLGDESKAVSTPCHRMTGTMARNVMLRVGLATDLGRCGPAASVKTGAAVRSAGACETDAPAEGQEHAGAHVKGSPRCLVVSGRQAEQQVVDVFPDSDWAGCAETRRSTSSSFYLGGHLLASPATTQKCGTDKLGRS